MTKADKFIFAACIAVAGIGFGVFGGIELSKRAALAARAAAEPWRQLPEWRGTQLTSNVPAPQPVIAAFEEDPPAPDGRKAFFSFCLPRQPIVKRRENCRGWYGSIDSVKPSAGGWEVEITIAAHNGVCYSTARTHETWQVSRLGATRCVACKTSGQPAIGMCDYGICFFFNDAAGHFRQSA